MPQQRRAQLTRRAIVVAAAEEFDRAGYDAVPLSAILRRSGVTKGAFYFHFSSKEELALALVRLQAERWPRLQRAWLRRELDPLSIAVGMLNDAARLIEQDVVIRAGTQLARHRIAEDEESHELAWEPLLQDLLRRSAVSGLLRPGVDPMAVARVAYTAVVGASVVGCSEMGPGAAARMEEVWRVTLRGVASPEWLSNRRSR
ncbi:MULTISPECIES: ScbR family autoregulator-binding transcription factor [Actinopolyspora]|uniref:DNA-binding transcriptional regulator, AcrR family n=1 Tax=Actinopolyspora saharensis TaxID=995062 RepID=A0A1H1G9N0_9ACTN|nr:MULTISPECIES: ScbR family autoregulator-binding transcription factor [Actinopolyspora]NHD16446.1 TetR/AcrR family transcriptional regulator [Actinopolyspora sp. BKK2]NHE75691.1 TetR/AcrR family transcriptional regulator [Actinopolyspora sp. BKK1]SDR09900.1 DNA-binding transcriptional regulator, AcrR family [Actinopolyspora saharensis]